MTDTSDPTRKTQPLKPYVYCGGARVELKRHARYLQENKEYLLARSLAVNSNLNAITKAMVCGRLISATQNELVYERSYYCAQTRLCKVCSYIAHQRRFEQRVDPLNFEVGLRLAHFVFRAPLAGTLQESAELTRACYDALIPIRKGVNGWNKKNPDLDNRIHAYSLGLHLKKRSDHRWLWPHLHLAMVVGKNVTINSDHLGSIGPHFAHKWAATTKWSDHGSVIWSDHGRLANKNYSPAERKSRHRGATVTKQHLVNEFAYAASLTETEHTLDEDIDQQQVLQLAGIADKVTFIANRVSCRNNDESPISVYNPHEFHSERLAKGSTFMFDLATNRPKKVALGDYDTDKQHLLADAGATVAAHRQSKGGS